MSAMDYLDEDQDRVFEGEAFAEEKFIVGAEAYAAAQAKQDAAGYRELTGQERVDDPTAHGGHAA